MPQSFRRFMKRRKRVSRSFVLFALRNGLADQPLRADDAAKTRKAHEQKSSQEKSSRNSSHIAQTAIPKGFDFVLNPRRNTNERDFEELRNELLLFLEQRHDPGIHATLGLRTLQFYKSVVSPWLPPACRFTPTCSEYASEAIQEYGLLRGVTPRAGAVAPLSSAASRRIRSFEIESAHL